MDNAAHGLAAWLDFRAVNHVADSLTLVATIQAQPGYPWRVRLEVTFTFDPQSLTQTVVATNESSTPAPFGVAGHPYLLAGKQS